MRHKTTKQIDAPLLGLRGSLEKKKAPQRKEMIYLEPRDVYDKALIQNHPAVYHYDLLIDTMMNAFDWTLLDAVEWFDVNIDPMIQQYNLIVHYDEN